MRILLAVDGSVSSDHATALVSTLALPAGSTIRVVAAQQPYSDALAMSWAAMGDAGANLETEEEQDARLLKEAVGRAESALARPDVTVEGFLLHGRPGSVICDEAGAFVRPASVEEARESLSAGAEGWIVIEDDAGAPRRVYAAE